MANIQPSLHFYGMIILVKKKGLCIGMPWLSFQKSYRFNENYLQLNNSEKFGYFSGSFHSFFPLVSSYQQRFLIVAVAIMGFWGFPGQLGACLQVCANSVLKFAKVDNADSPNTLIMRTSTHTYLRKSACELYCWISHKFADLDAEFRISMQNSAIVCKIQQKCYYF